MIQDYVSRIEEACGAAKTKDYIVILKQDRREEALKRALEKSKVLAEVHGVAVKASFMGREFTAFTNGRLMFKSLKDRDELKTLLEELLK
ncbi:MAG: hypothetical protein FGF51_07990 [Candidatus Brockarchaeota archaeon]|nr:hypothetical protein [Candidatus Brockarchaeota archaeon]MBO3808774.1 hypothetical protein [Candidatus Brockarchaeota archaeon]MBO3833299.1 hypothetical protein [Candidatus Brockarchaeota archaeon]